MRFTQEHDAFRKVVRDVVEHEIAPHVDAWERAGTFPAHELFPQLGEVGLLGLEYDEAYGGGGADHLFTVVACEELARSGAAGIPMAIGVQTSMATPSLHEYGTDDLKRRFLAPAIAGTAVCSIAVTEAGAGSDVASIRTRAVRDGDEWVINGSKLYITNGTQADWLCLLARTSDEGGHRGMSQIVVETASPGVRVSRKLDKLGNRCSDTAELVFEDVRVPVANTIGTIGRGFQQQMSQFVIERMFAAYGIPSSCRWALERTRDHLRERQAFGRPLLANQYLGFTLAELAAQVDLLQSHNYQTAEAYVAGEDTTRQATVAKLMSGRLIRQVADTCVQFHGGMGYMEETWTSRFFRDSRLVSIGGGADEVMLQVLAKLDGFSLSRAADNRAALLERLAELADERARAGGSATSLARHRARGKLTARERIELLLDRDSPFLELSPYAAWGTDFPVGASLVTGIGVVEGVEVMVVANDPTVRGGTSNPYTLRKGGRAHDIAEANRLPYVSLVESGGADLPTQSEIFLPGGRGFRNLTRLSAAGIPTIALVFGTSTAGGAYVPGMSDHVVMVDGRSKVFLAGPPLVKMATGEDADDEELGGASMHARTSGLADHLAVDEVDAVRLGRQVVRHLNWRKRGPGPTLPADPPLLDADGLLDLAPADLRQPLDPRDVLARVVDGSRFDEHKPLYGTSLVTGWASIHGHPVGVLANARGVLFRQDAEKAAQFIQLANQVDTPLLFLQNTTGYMVGAQYEQDGIIKAGAQMINAVSNSRVPHLTLNIGASYGAGNYGMCGRAYDPRFLFTWPNAKSAVMGPAQLAGVLDIVGRASAQAQGRDYDEEAATAMRAAVEQQIEAESLALFLSGRLYDDGIIDPRDTRTVLGLALSVVHGAPVEGLHDGWGVFRL